MSSYEGGLPVVSPAEVPPLFQSTEKYYQTQAAYLKTAFTFYDEPTQGNANELRITGAYTLTALRGVVETAFSDRSVTMSSAIDVISAFVLMQEATRVTAYKELMPERHFVNLGIFSDDERQWLEDEVIDLRGDAEKIADAVVDQTRELMQNELAALQDEIALEVAYAQHQRDDWC